MYKRQPYYTEDGQFLGVDENGFTGNIYITDEEVFEKYSKNGIANSKDIPVLNLLIGNYGDEEMEATLDINSRSITNSQIIIALSLIHI